MKFTKIALAVAALLGTSTVAHAASTDNFTGPRISVTAGINDIQGVPDTTDVTYGLVAGLDVKVAGPVTFGVEAGLDNVFDRRDVNVNARLGLAVSDNVLVFTKAGYTSFNDAYSRKLDGYRVGGGLELAISKNVFVTGEYRYSDYEVGVGSHGGALGIGLRF